MNRPQTHVEGIRQLHDKIADYLEQRYPGKLARYSFPELHELEETAKQREEPRNHAISLHVQDNQVTIYAHTPNGERRLLTAALQPTTKTARRLLGAPLYKITFPQEPDTPAAYQTTINGLKQKLREPFQTETPPLTPQELARLRNYPQPIAVTAGLAAKKIDPKLVVSSEYGRKIILFHKRPYKSITTEHDEKTGNDIHSYYYFEDFEGKKRGDENKPEKNEEVNDAYWNEVASNHVHPTYDYLRLKQGKLGAPHTLELYRPEAELIADAIITTFKQALPTHRFKVIKKYEN